MAAVPEAVDSYLRALREGSRTGRVSARRQVEGCITQARTIAAADGFFHTLTEGSGRPTALSGDLERAAEAASQAYGKLADVMADELAPVSRAEDAVGRDEYALPSRLHVGVTVDLDETYAWGLSRSCSPTRRWTRGVPGVRARPLPGVARPGAELQDRRAPWHRLRDDYAAQVRAAGEEFDLAAFHRRALDVGSVGMDTLRRSLLR